MRRNDKSRQLITDADGQVVVRNRIAESFADARHSDALVEAAIDELLGEALVGALRPRLPTLE